MADRIRGHAIVVALAQLPAMLSTPMHHRDPEWSQQDDLPILEWLQLKPS